MQKAPKRTGERQRYSIDRLSQEKINLINEWFERNKDTMSHSVLIRRAVRVYCDYLMTLSTPAEVKQELLETNHALRGVL